MSRFSRRNFLRTASSGLVLPFVRPPKLYAQESIITTPKRFIVFMFPQGTVMEQFVPVGDTNSYTFPYILEPLTPWMDKSIVVTGVDNLSPQLPCWKRAPKCKSCLLSAVHSMCKMMWLFPLQARRLNNTSRHSSAVDVHLN